MAYEGAWSRAESKAEEQKQLKSSLSSRAINGGSEMLIKLTPDEWQVLKEVLAEADSVPCPALSGDQPVLEITDETADEYSNLLQDEFEVRGMDERYEPTVRGRILESLIDKLFTG